MPKSHKLHETALGRRRFYLLCNMFKVKYSKAEAHQLLHEGLAIGHTKIAGFLSSAEFLAGRLTARSLFGKSLSISESSRLVVFFGFVGFWNCTVIMDVGN